MARLQFPPKLGGSGTPFNPAAPGPIGGTTPAAITGTIITGDPPASVTGTGTTTTSGYTVTGSGTAFTTELQVGSIVVRNSITIAVRSITSDTVLTGYEFIGTDATARSFTYTSPSVVGIGSATTEDRAIVRADGALLINNIVPQVFLDRRTFRAWSFQVGDSSANYPFLVHNYGSDVNGNPFIINGTAPDSSLEVQSSTLGGAVKVKGLRTARTAGGAGNYTVLQTDMIVTVDNTASARDVTLPSAATSGAGRVFIVKDEIGNALVNNITVKSASGTLDGVAAATGVAIVTNYGVSRWYSNGTNWFSF